jgi:hypothetical protein
MTAYEYWQHPQTLEVWAVKLTDGKVAGATQIGQQDVHQDLLPHFAYRSDDVDELNRDRDVFRKVDGRKVA